MLQEKTIREDYFDWLYKQINNRKGSFKKLCHILHEKQFRWFVPNDDNRCQDGLDLRQTFIDDRRLDEAHTEVRYFLKGGCTVFETLVGIAIRLEFLNTDTDEASANPAKWFHILLINLGLDSFRDRDEFTRSVTEPIDYILDRMIDRTYDYYGNGSLFPMKRKPPKDMRKTEIWYQMMYWRDENYGMG